MLGNRHLFTIAPGFLLLALISLAIACGGESVSETVCEQEFRKAAAIDDMNDTVTDLDRAVRFCTTLDEWVAANIKHPAALDGASPLVYLQNRCRYGPTQAQVCKEVLP